MSTDKDIVRNTEVITHCISFVHGRPVPDSTDKLESDLTDRTMSVPNTSGKSRIESSSTAVSNPTPATPESASPRNTADQS
ncbi:hypothetical protein ElyMa_001800000 [Elysia marginata]|uniref:Uncharacterized protein n=1 Tax=Elysia marginata TaxID=1093978 RepID=A0AAV4EEV6_9GAST|nr:hypothetical protein ElyMa_001800000 [Elysia marginata]